MAKFNLEPETSLSHVWVTAITTSEVSMTGINFPSDQPSRLIFLKYIINRPCSKLLQALPIVHEAKAKCLVVSSEVLRNWSPPGCQPHCIPFLLGLQWTSCTFLPGAASPPVLQTHHILKDLVQLWEEVILHHLGIPMATSLGP